MRPTIYISQTNILHSSLEPELQVSDHGAEEIAENEAEGGQIQLSCLLFCKEFKFK
jgi:hypothetical protein